MEHLLYYYIVIKLLESGVAILGVIAIIFIVAILIAITSGIKAVCKIIKKALED